MSQTLADFEFHAQDRNATRRTNAPKEGDATDGDGQKLQMSVKVVRQGAWRQVFSNLRGSLKIEMRMNMLVETNVHHGCQFAPDLRGGMQGNGHQPFLQPSVEVLDGSIAPGFVFGDEGEVDPDQQCQADESVEGIGMGSQSEEIAVVDLQNVGQPQPLPGSYDKRQDPFHTRFWLQFDKNGPIVDVPVDQKVPLPPRSFQIARSDQIQLMALVAVHHPDRGVAARTGTRFGSK